MLEAGFLCMPDGLYHAAPLDIAMAAQCFGCLYQGGAGRVARCLSCA